MLRRKTADFHARFTPDVYDRLQRHSDRCCLSKNEYLSRLICGTVPREVPPLDYDRLVTTMNLIGNSIAEVADFAKTTGMANAALYEEWVEKLFDEISSMNKQFHREDPINERAVIRYGPD